VERLDDQPNVDSDVVEQKDKDREEEQDADVDVV